MEDEREVEKQFWVPKRERERRDEEGKSRRSVQRGVLEKKEARMGGMQGKCEENESAQRAPEPEKI